MKRHPFDIVSFIFGIAFAGLGLTFLVTEVRSVDIGAEWIWPFVLIIIGLAVVGAALRSQSDESASTEAQDRADR